MRRWTNNGNILFPVNSLFFVLLHFNGILKDDKDLEGYNVDEKVSLFVAEVKAQASDYATNHIMLTMGSDFQYKNADQWFVNLDKLIKYVNEAVW